MGCLLPTDLATMQGRLLEREQLDGRERGEMMFLAKCSQELWGIKKGENFRRRM